MSGGIFLLGGEGGGQSTNWETAAPHGYMPAALSGRFQTVGRPGEVRIIFHHSL